MINEVVLVGRIKEVIEEEKKKNLLLEVERPFNENEGRVNDTFNCKLWNVIFNKIVNNCKIGDLLAIKGRIISENSEYIVVAEKVVILNKSHDNILK